MSANKIALRVALASDHAGYDLKEELKQLVTDLGHQANDLGTDSNSRSVDYPDFGYALAGSVEAGEAAFGIVVCGSGIGISIAANRNPAVRAALCNNGTTARLARAHNDANVLALGARMIGREVAFDCVRAFLETEFEGGRHGLRVAKLAKD